MKFSYQVLLAALTEIDALTDALSKANARIKELEEKQEKPNGKEKA